MDSRFTPTSALVGTVEARIGKKATDWQRPDCGLSAAQRFTVTFDDGSRVFVKAAVDPPTEEWLRTDYRVMSSIAEDFVPRVIDWIDSGDPPVLIMQDLSHAHWPASHAGVDWRAGQVDVLLETLERVARTEPPAGLPPLEIERTSWSRWIQIEASPRGFLELGLCSPGWLQQTARTLIEAQDRVDLSGHELIHGDVRSDNVCFIDDRVVLVDWSSARRGNARRDLVWLLPGLCLEEAADPYDALPDAGDWAALHAGELAWRASTETAMPAWFIKVLTRLAAITLDWAARSLELPRPDGVQWREI